MKKLDSSRSRVAVSDIVAAQEPAIEILGEVERIEKSVAIGWLFDKARPEIAVAFDLLVNDVSIGSYIADRKRPGLLRRNIGSGYNGFRVKIPDGVLRKGVNTVAVEVAGQMIGDILSYDHSDNASDSASDSAEINTRNHPDPGTVQAGPSKVQRPQTSAPDRKERTPAQPSLTQINPGLKLLELTSLPLEQVEILVSNILSKITLSDKELGAIIEGSFNRRHWHIVNLVCKQLHDHGRLPRSFLIRYGRSLLHSNRHQDALPILRQAAEADPTRHANIFYLGLAEARVQNWAAAAEIFERCITLADNQSKYFHEAARAYIPLAYGGYGVFAENRALIQTIVTYLKRALELDPKAWRPCRELSAILIGAGKYDEALSVARMATERQADAAAPFTELASVCLRLNRIDEAVEAAKRALELDPAGDVPKFNLRIASRLLETCNGAPKQTIEVMLLNKSLQLDAALPPEVRVMPVEKKSNIGELVKSSDASWIAIGSEPGLSVSEIVEDVNRLGFDWCAGIRRSENSVPHIWRRDYLAALSDAGLLKSIEDLREASSAAARHGNFATAQFKPDLARKFPVDRTVLLLTQYGVRKFGGGEHFIQQMALLYRELGFKILVVGTQGEQPGARGEQNGIPFAYIGRSATDLLRLAVVENAVLAHAISGLGYEAAAALRFLNVAIVHGIHFWRDMLAPSSPSTGYYPDVDLQAEPRQEFSSIIQDCETVYSNSHFTQARVEKYFGARTPIIFSLPDNAPAEAVANVTAERRDFVLLANARNDKGLGLLARVAALLPDVRFKAIASQSDKAAALSVIEQLGLTNFEILDYVEHMPDLYAKARVVAVPSYSFVETFSRVVIEAHRYGVPVVGSDRGNVPHLLVESGISLPEDPGLWAKEIGRLFAEDGYWRERAGLALQNSERYSFNMQRGRLSGLLSGLASPLLVGVGSGLGNIIHTTPLIRNLARRLGRRVDVVVAGDYLEMLFVAANSEYVNHVFAFNEDVLKRRYEAVFLSHSFGALKPAFSSQVVYASRNWDVFSPDHSLHEAEFNLAAAEAVLGVPYEPEDITGYYIGEFKYARPREMLVGFHAGSKGGRWASKRWPHYEELARRLTVSGIKVASFGLADEYVPGTLDMTGGTIEEMTAKMLACSHFVANDSGVMNVANALGIPLIALFGPTNGLTRGPLKSTSKTISVKRDCSPCEMHPLYKDSHFTPGICKCIEDLDIDTVQQALLSMMD